MSKRKGTHRLLMAGAVMGTAILMAGCQAAAPVEVAQLPPTATRTSPSDTPAPATPAALEPKPVVNTATAPVQEPVAAVAPIETPSTPATESEGPVAAALEYLGQALGVPVQEIEVRSVEAVQWSDGSLGCPQPGMGYAQMITPGYSVLLEVDGKAYEIHTDMGRSVVLCEREDSAMVVPPGSGTGEPGLGPFIAKATEDLAGRLSIAEGEIEVLEAIAVVWPDASLGCPQPGMTYAQFITPGFRIVLEVAGVLHEYHTDQAESVVWCGVLDPGVRPLEDGRANVQDGWPSQPITDDVILEPPAERKQEP